MQLLTSCVDYLDKESDTELTLPMVFEDKTRTGLACQCIFSCSRSLLGIRAEIRMGYSQ